MHVSSTKRQKEQARLQHRREKEERKKERKRLKAERPERKPGDPDPDLEGLVAGPQPVDPALVG